MCRLMPVGFFRGICLGVFLSPGRYSASCRTGRPRPAGFWQIQRSSAILVQTLQLAASCFELLSRREGRMDAALFLPLPIACRWSCDQLRGRGSPQGIPSVEGTLVGFLGSAPARKFRADGALRSHTHTHTLTHTLSHTQARLRATR